MWVKDIDAVNSSKGKISVSQFGIGIGIKFIGLQASCLGKVADIPAFFLLIAIGQNAKKTIIGASPYIALVVDQDAVNYIIAKALLGSDVGKSIITLVKKIESASFGANPNIIRVSRIIQKTGNVVVIE